MMLHRIRAAAAFIVLASTVSYGQSFWPQTAAERLKVVAGHDDVALLTGAASDGYYGVLVGWQNTSDNTVYIERIDPLGSRLWQDDYPAGQDGNPSRVSVFGTGGQSELGVGSDLEKGAWAAWVDERDGVRSVYLQRLNEDGSRSGHFALADVLVSEEARILSGTISFVSGNATVTGTGTNFDKQVRPGDWIRIESDGVWRQVDSSAAITATSLTLDVAPTVDITDEVGSVVTYPVYLPLAGNVSVAANGGQLSATATFGAADLAELEAGDMVRVGTEWFKIIAKETATTARVLPNATQALAAAVVSKHRIEAALTVDDVTWDNGLSVATADLLTDAEMIRAGDQIRPVGGPDVWYRVQSVSGTNITLATPYAGVNLTAQAEILARDGRSTFRNVRAPQVLGVEEGCYVAYRSVTEGLASNDKIADLLTVVLVNADGRRLWSVDVDFPHPDTDVELYPDGVGGVIVVWTVPAYASAGYPDFDSEMPGPNTIYALRLNSAGVGVWGEEPIILFKNADAEVEVSFDPELHEIWVSGTFYYRNHSNDVPTAVDNGDYVVVNKLRLDGTWAWSNWSKPFQWDSQEKGVGNVDPTTGFIMTLPRFDDYHTYQSPAGVIRDGKGGAYVMAKDNRRTNTGSANITALSGGVTFNAGSNIVIGDASTLFTVEVQAGQYIRATPADDWYQVYRVNADNQLVLTSASAVTVLASATAEVADSIVGDFSYGPTDLRNVYGHHVSPNGSLQYNDSGYTVRWDDNASGMYATLASDLTLVWTEYPWAEGYSLTGQITGTMKAFSDIFCEPWNTYNPVEGHRLANQVTFFWAEDEDASGGLENVYAAQRDFLGAGFRSIIISGLGNLAPDNYKFISMPEERYGVTVVWEEHDAGDRNVYAKHFNYLTMMEDGRVIDLIGSGPDIFPPPPVTNLKAEAGIGNILLRWENPAAGVKPLTDFAGVTLVYRTDTYPQTPTDGTILLNGSVSELYDHRETSPGVGLETGVSYYYSLFTYDTELGERNYSSPVSVLATVQLSDVIDFTAVGYDGEVELTWENPPSGQYAGVIIRRSVGVYPASEDEGDLVGDFATPIESYTDTGLTNNTRYRYSAFAYDSSNNYSARGATAWAVPLEPVSDLTFDLTVQGTASMTWTVPAHAEFSETLIYRATQVIPATVTSVAEVLALGGIEVTKVPSGQASLYPDAGLAHDQTYYYALFARYQTASVGIIESLPVFGSVGPADWPPPGEITGFTHTLGNLRIDLEWTYPVDINLSKVVITYHTNLNATELTLGEFTPAAADNPATPIDERYEGAFSHTGLTAGTIYTYTATAYDSVARHSSPVTLTVTAVDNLPPVISNVSFFQTTGRSDSGSLTWQVADEDDVRYTISYGATAQGLWTGTVSTTAYSAEGSKSAALTKLWPGSPSMTFHYRLTVTDERGASATHTGTFPVIFRTGEDTNSNGILDTWETQYFGGQLQVAEADLLNPVYNNTVPGTVDADSVHLGYPAGQGLTVLQEYRYGTNPGTSDTDGDGLSDYVELFATYTNPHSPPMRSIGFKEGCGATGEGAPMALTLGLMAMAIVAFRGRAGRETL